MITFWAPSNIIATSSASDPTLVRVRDSFSPEPPNALNNTSGNVLFIALHIMKVRISPDAPTRDPATIKTELFMMKPVNAAAIPESEFSKDTTTGMSAPPIGNTSNIPSVEETPIKA